MDTYGSKRNPKASGVDQDYDSLEDVLQKLPPGRQDALKDWLDEQEQEETKDAGGSTSASND
jgi:hypothetical protein